MTARQEGRLAGDALVARARAGRGPRRGLATVALWLALSLPLVACDSTASYERGSNGSMVLLDRLSPAVKAAARRKIIQSLRQGVAVYDLGIGDDIEVFFHRRRQPIARAYRIAPSDELRISFLNDAQNDQSLKVAPDGHISVPLLGSVIAAGRTPDTLARDLERRYSRLLPEPKITVSITGAHSRLKDFLDAISSDSGRRSLVEKVLPDGTIVLPQLPPLRVAGLPLAAVERKADAAYAARGLGVFISLVPRTLHSNSTLVIGEVGKPGQIELSRPTTVLMAVAQAGGVTRTGTMTAVRLYYTGPDRVLRVRTINLKAELSDLSLEDDMIVPPNSIIYVPPTELAKAGRFLDTLLRDILQYQGINIFGSFQIAPPSNNGGITILQSPAK